MNLIIVESPTKAKTLSKFLGKDFMVMATMGHIKDLPKSTLGVDIEKDFKPEYELVGKRMDIIESLKLKAKSVKQIYLATDPDREGEAIASHVEEVLKDKKSHKPVSRITFHEITKEAVEDAISHPAKIDKDLVSAQIARRVLDRLVGYKLSPLLWRKVRRGLSAGRVQTVTVRLIIDKEREIEAFKVAEYWEILVQVSKAGGSPEDSEFAVSLIKVNGKRAEIGNEKEAKRIVSDLESADYKVESIQKREVVKDSYAPFTTSTLTQAASRIFFWSSKKTMNIAQQLYEEGLITYHRTDSTNVAASALNRVRGYIKQKYGDKYLPDRPRVFKTKSKLAQEAHEAIRPTNVTANFEISNHKYEMEAKILYNLIWKRFLASQMTPSVYDETKILVTALRKVRREVNNYQLLATGLSMKFDGWRILFNKKESDNVILPEVTEGEKLKFIKVTSEQKFTQPPARYTEASLIKTLEKLGIGRPSTYAPIVSTIQIRNYVEKKEGKFFPTTIGVAVNDFLVPNFTGVFDYGFTADMEGEFDDIAEGKIERIKVLGDFWEPFDKKLVSVEKNSKRVKIETEKLGKKCPECKKGDLVIRLGRFGKFISCSTFPDCKYTDKYIEKINIKCPECKIGEVIIKTSRKGRRFYGCSRYPECKWASWRKPS